jgi:thiol-disulfide isomerase/thioredoxin
MDSSGLTHLGEVFLNQENYVDAGTIFGASVIGIYFSAHWCPPCRAFTPKLVQFYEDVNKEQKQFEVIFVSSDKDETSFKEYYKTMPWLAIPFGDPLVTQLKQKYGVSGIPKLVLLKPDGTLMEGVDARTDVQNGPDSFKKWLDQQ